MPYITISWMVLKSGMLRPCQCVIRGFVTPARPGLPFSEPLASIHSRGNMKRSNEFCLVDWGPPTNLVEFIGNAGRTEYNEERGGKEDEVRGREKKAAGAPAVDRAQDRGVRQTEGSVPESI